MTRHNPPDSNGGQSNTGSVDAAPPVREYHGRSAESTVKGTPESESKNDGRKGTIMSFWDQRAEMKRDPPIIRTITNEIVDDKETEKVSSGWKTFGYISILLLILAFVGLFIWLAVSYKSQKENVVETPDCPPCTTVSSTDIMWAEGAPKVQYVAVKTRVGGAEPDVVAGAAGGLAAWKGECTAFPAPLRGKVVVGGEQYDYTLARIQIDDVPVGSAQPGDTERKQSCAPVSASVDCPVSEGDAMYAIAVAPKFLSYNGVAGRFTARGATLDECIVYLTYAMAIVSRKYMLDWAFAPLTESKTDDAYNSLVHMPADAREILGKEIDIGTMNRLQLSLRVVAYDATTATPHREAERLLTLAAPTWATRVQPPLCRLADPSKCRAK